MKMGRAQGQSGGSAFAQRSRSELDPETAAVDERLQRLWAENLVEISQEAIDAGDADASLAVAKMIFSDKTGDADPTVAALARVAVVAIEAGEFKVLQKVEQELRALTSTNN
jgi:hypothetical protein